MQQLKLISKIIYLIALGSCATQPEPATKYDTSTLNLKGNIKHITAKESDGQPKVIDIEFKDNKVVAVKTERPATDYQFEYEGQQLKRITYRGGSMQPAEFPLAFELTQPLMTYNADSVIKNKHGDVVKAFFKGENTSEGKVYRIEYTYDAYNNWTVRQLFYGNNEVVLDRTDRTFLYEREIPNNEIARWNEQADSIYKQCANRNELANLIDTTIDKNRQRLKQIDGVLKKYNKEASATDTIVMTMVADFNKTYGREYLSPALLRVQKKLETLRMLTLNQQFLYREVGYVVPLLESGRKTIKDTLEPYSNRYTLTYSFELIERLKNLELKYVAQ